LCKHTNGGRDRRPPTPRRATILAATCRVRRYIRNPVTVQITYLAISDPARRCVHSLRVPPYLSITSRVFRVDCVANTRSSGDPHHEHRAADRGDQVRRTRTYSHKTRKKWCRVLQCATRLLRAVLVNCIVHRHTPASAMSDSPHL
jgi:hypothetical protein